MNSTVANPDPQNLSRFWVYQRERFPLLGHGLLIAAFSSCAVVYSAQLRHAIALPPVQAFAVAFVTCFLLFLQLRIADEFKDFDEDSRFRPYRPVPRGLVTLRELSIVFVGGTLVQGVLAILHHPRLLLWLILVWGYLALMSKEFFARDWLKRRPVIYLLSHMVILPLVDFYAAACDWILHGPPPIGLLWFVLASYSNGIVIELGRKIRVPADEEAGVETYSFLWGRRAACIAWCGAVVCTAILATVAAHATGHAMKVGIGTSVGVLGAIAMAVWFLGRETRNAGKRIEQFSGIWTIWLYLWLGWITWLTR
jgi:4-hydroxybenzoate polyprenyltransferase